MFPPDSQLSKNKIAAYQIKVKGDLDDNWSDWFSGLKIQSGKMPDGSTISILMGAIQDQAELRGVLIKLLDLNLVLISVQRIQSPQDK
jgi:hypothetical protein